MIYPLTNSSEANITRESIEKDEKKYKDVLFKLLFDFQKNVIKKEPLNNADSDIRFKQQLDLLKSKIENDFLKDNDNKNTGDMEDWMKKNHKHIYNDIDITNLSFFVKKKAKDYVEQESFKHKFISNEIVNKSDFYLCRRNRI